MLRFVEEHRDNILKWLSDLDIRSHHLGIFERLMLGTGEWLLEKDEFIRWQTSVSSSMLWIRDDG